MGVLVFLALILLSFLGFSSAQYCVCKTGSSVPDPYKKVIDYACANGADCGPVQPNGPCYEANNIQAICSYAANSYFQNKKSFGATCDFANVAAPSTSLPTDLPSGCIYPTSAGSGGVPTNSSAPASSADGSNDATSQRRLSAQLISLSLALFSGFILLWA